MMKSHFETHQLSLVINVWGSLGYFAEELLEDHIAYNGYNS